MTQIAFTSGSAFPELQKDVLRIYSSRICPYAQRARLVLAHKNIPHEVVNVELRDKPEWFLTTSPAGKVPVIQKNDMILNESTAVSEYLDDVYPGERLQEDDPYKKAKDRILLEYFGQFTSAYYGIVMAPANANTMEDFEKKAEQIQKHFRFFEDELGQRSSLFFGGTKPKMIDFFLWPHMERVPVLTKIVSKVSLTNTQFPRLAGWWEAMTQLPAVKQEMFNTEWHLQVFDRMMNGKPYGNLGLEE